MTDVHGGESSVIFGMPLVLWIGLSLALVATLTAIVVAIRSSITVRKSLEQELARHTEHLLRQVQFDGEQRRLQREHDAEQFTRRLADAAAERARELTHDAEQRHREREDSRRTEVLLEAAVAVVDLLTLVGRAARLEFDEVLLLEEFRANQARIIRVHVVGVEATVDSVMTYMNEVEPAFNEALLRRAALVSRKNAIDAGILEADAAALERDGHAAVLKLSGTDEARSAPRMRAVEAQWRSAGERFTAAQVKLAASRAALLEEQQDASRRVAHLVAQATRLVPATMTALRGEFATALDRRRYERLWSVHFSKIDFIRKQARDSVASPIKELPLGMRD